jgi:hypothetical protein
MSKSDRESLMPTDWETYFRDADVRVEELDACKSKRGRAIKIGQFLSPLVGREVLIEVKGRTGRAVLRVESHRSKAKRYFFEVTFDTADEQEAEHTIEPLTEATKSAEQSRRRRAQTDGSPQPKPSRLKAGHKGPDKGNGLNKEAAAAAGGKPKSATGTVRPEADRNNEDWD